jgi:hypothetical protein
VRKPVRVKFGCPDLFPDKTLYSQYFEDEIDHIHVGEEEALALLETIAGDAFEEAPENVGAEGVGPR